MTELAEWESFYIIVGPSAGALIGLQFVVLTLIGERPSLRMAEAGSIYEWRADSQALAARTTIRARTA